MNYKEFYNDVYGKDNLTDGPHGWIQWKGTDVCIDLQCSCGHQGHYDGYFLYFFECPSCKAKYALGQNVKLIPLTAEQVQYVEESSGFKTCDLESDE